MIRTGLKSCALALLPLVLPLSVAGAGDGVAVDSVAIERTPATPSGPYTIAGKTIRYGVGTNVRITDAVVGSLALGRSAVSKPEITIKRINNATVTGPRMTLFYPALVGPNATTGPNVDIEGDEATSMEQAMNDDYLTSGGLDVFLNVDNGVEKANNIERIDFVIEAGIVLPTTPALLTEIGTIANEKHGNNSYQIAMITSVDAFGNPTGYGDLKTIERVTATADYGDVGRPRNAAGTDMRNAYIRNGVAGTGPNEYIRSDTNFIGLSFVSFAAMGATPSQTVYGYSLFPLDMTDTHDLVGLTDAPLNTSGSANGGDIYGGTFAIFSTPAAEAETSEGGTPDLIGTKTVEVYDPANEGLYNIPGNDVVYTISVSNVGDGSPDVDSIFLVDTLPPDIEFFNGDIDGPGPQTSPVAFINSASGLSFNYGSDIGYSMAASAPTNFIACSYTPIIDYDPAVKHICFRPTGTMDHGGGPPSFEFKFRARVK